MKNWTIFFTIILIVGAMACKQQPKTASDEAPNMDTFRGKVGLQLYSLRDQIQADLDKALAFAKEQGITDVELAGTAGLTPEQFKVKLDEYGLKPSSMHVGLNMLRDSIDKVIADAKMFGVQYVGCAWIDHKSDTITLDEIKGAVTAFNEIGKKLKDNGFQFFYHIHGYEFIPYENSNYFDYLYNNTDPQNVMFEEDIFWVKHGGQDPLAFLQKYGSRIPLLHIKDMDKRVVPDMTGQEKPEMDVAWGTGQIDIKAICQLAQQMGATHFYLEDESPTVEAQIPQSLKYAESF